MQRGGGRLEMQGPDYSNREQMPQPDWQGRLLLQQFLAALGLLESPTLAEAGHPPGCPTTKCRAIPAEQPIGQPGVLLAIPGAWGVQQEEARGQGSAEVTESATR